MSVPNEGSASADFFTSFGDILAHVELQDGFS